MIVYYDSDEFYPYITLMTKEDLNELRIKDKYMDEAWFIADLEESRFEIDEELYEKFQDAKRNFERYSTLVQEAWKKSKAWR
jgi:hypothetical protein